MKKLLNLSALILTAAITLSFSGCVNNTVDELTTYEIPEQECIISIDVESQTYTYSDKLEVYMSTEKGADTLSINCGIEDKKHWKEILSGDFISSVWNDYKYFVFCDNVYYEFDIENYNIPKDFDKDAKYELKEYSKDEFAKAYPDCETFNWNQPFLEDINKVPEPMN